jgi:hypothetical protein
MRNSTLIRRKVKLDQALNLSELSRVSGYDRGSLTGMMLPLTAGKIFYTDFRRVLRSRQDAHESSVAALVRHNGFTHPSGITLAAAVVAAARPMRAAADKFRAPKSRRARPAASHAPAESRARSTG